MSRRLSEARRRLYAFVSIQVESSVADYRPAEAEERGARVGSRVSGGAYEAEAVGPYRGALHDLAELAESSAVLGRPPGDGRLEPLLHSSRRHSSWSQPASRRGGAETVTNRHDPPALRARSRGAAGSPPPRPLRSRASTRCLPRSPADLEERPSADKPRLGRASLNACGRLWPIQPNRPIGGASGAPTRLRRSTHAARGDPGRRAKAHATPWIYVGGPADRGRRSLQYRPCAPTLRVLRC